VRCTFKEARWPSNRTSRVVIGVSIIAFQSLATMLITSGGSRTLFLRYMIIREEFGNFANGG